MKTKYTKASGAGGRKIPKTLSGIETVWTHTFAIQFLQAGKYLKPYQGLKLDYFHPDSFFVLPENT